MIAGRVTKFLSRVRSLTNEEKAEPTQQKRDPILQLGGRWEACLFLDQAGITYKIWSLPDVFYAHGSHEWQRCDLHLLVMDLEEAAIVLEARGYLRTSLTGYQRMVGYSQHSANVLRLVSESEVAEGLDVFPYEDVINNLTSVHDALGTIFIRGVALFLAKDWKYQLPSSPNQPIPELYDYFDSHISLWMDEEFPLYDLRKMHITDLIQHLICKIDRVWTVDFEKAVKKEHRQILFYLMKRSREVADNPDIFPVGLLLQQDLQFRASQKTIRDEIIAGVREPVVPRGFVRERPKTWARMLTTEGRKQEEERYRNDLPKFTWLVKFPGISGWLLISLNLSHILEWRKWERRFKILNEHVKLSETHRSGFYRTENNDGKLE